jgi:pilus assembly protein Flp/PilA
MIQFLAIMLNAHRDEEKGATAVEYGLMVALIAVAIITIVTTLGGSLSSLFSEVNESITGAGTGGA